MKKAYTISMGFPGIQVLLQILPMLLATVPAASAAERNINECVNELLERSIRGNIYSRGYYKETTTNRDWKTYVKSLVIKSSDRNGKGLLIDLGAGEAVALRQAVEAGEFERGIAIDFHDYNDLFDHEYSTTEVMHRIRREEGAAEKVLERYDSVADVIVDNYGAFTYSSARLHLLQSAYHALKPGGRAYLRVPPVAWVRTSKGTLLPLETWLAKRHPGIFSVRSSERFFWKRDPLDEMMSANRVLVMSRGKKAALPDLRLRLESEKTWYHPDKPFLQIPLLTFSEAGAR